MKLSRLGVAICLVAALVLSGCDTFDFASNWFTSKKKSNIKGERISVMSMDESLKPDETLASIDVVLPPPYRNSEWPEPGGYAANAMYHLQADGPLRQLWQQDTGKGSDDDSRLTAPPVVADGRIFVLDAQAHVYVFEANSGKPLWDKNLAPDSPDSGFTMWGLFGQDMSIDPSKGFGGGVAFDAGKLFVTTGFGTVYALDPASGKQLWKSELGVPIVNAPSANGGRVFVSSEDNHFYALAEIDGRTLWDQQGITEFGGHSGKHQRRRGRRLRRGAVHVGRALRDPRRERPPGLERHAHKVRQRDGSVRARRHRGTAGHRSRHGDRHQPFRHHGRYQHQHRRPRVVARHRRHPELPGSRAISSMC